MPYTYRPDATILQLLIVLAESGYIARKSLVKSFGFSSFRYLPLKNSESLFICALMYLRLDG